MAQEVCVVVGAEDRARLTAIIGDRSRPLKHLQRSRIVLFSTDRLPVIEVARRAGSAVRRCGAGSAAMPRPGWKVCCATRPRPPGKAPVAPATVAEVLALTCAEPPGETTHWTGRAMAKAVGLSLRTIQRISEKHRLQPHRIRTFKRSTDPAFAEKVEDIVGLYMHPPAHAVVLSIDEKSQIQALDRTQPGLPLKPGKCGTMTHDYKRHGTTTLFAAFNTLDGVVLGRCMQRHTHQEFIRFLNAVDRMVATDKPVHAILDNYATHKHPKSLPSRKRGSKLGLPAIRAGPSTSRQPRAPGSTPSRTSSPHSPESASSAASSAPSPTSRPPSTAISKRTMTTPSPSSGPNPPTPSSPSSTDCLYLPFEPVH